MASAKRKSTARSSSSAKKLGKDSKGSGSQSEEELDKELLQLKLSACQQWVKVINEKFALGHNDEALIYLKLLHENLMFLSRIANRELLRGPRYDLDPYHKLGFASGNSGK